LKRLVLLSLSVALLLILVPGCVTIQIPASENTMPPRQPSVIGTFSSNPSAINPGGTSNLTWNVTGANTISIDQGIGVVNASGTMAISPAASTIYTISATNATGTVTSSTVTTVNPAAPPQVRMPPVIVDFSSTLNPDGSSTLSWNVAGADEVSIDQYIGIVNAAGTRVVSPEMSTVYTLSATYLIGNWANEVGTVTRSVTTAALVSHTPWVN
jgi:hypothetical protein